jgi:hypothetical protein
MDHEGSDLTNGLIHLWIYNLMGYWEVVGTLELVGDNQSLGCALGGPIFSLFLSFSLSPCFLATMN